MKPTEANRIEAQRIAAHALPCPFCGERLVVHTDHHGCWVAHKEEPGPCLISVIQLLDDDDLELWNRRAE